MTADILADSDSHIAQFRLRFKEKLRLLRDRCLVEIGEVVLNPTDTAYLLDAPEMDFCHDRHLALEDVSVALGVYDNGPLITSKDQVPPNHAIFVPMGMTISDINNVVCTPIVHTLCNQSPEA